MKIFAPKALRTLFEVLRRLGLKLRFSPLMTQILYLNKEVGSILKFNKKPTLTDGALYVFS